jgi:hypothetical protein
MPTSEAQKKASKTYYDEPKAGIYEGRREYFQEYGMQYREALKLDEAKLQEKRNYYREYQRNRRTTASLVDLGLEFRVALAS